ncbi:hypothetical protein ACF06W_11400 [Streptomyces albus]|uniref:hypothetical protein n=1 Tax=Streptomyces albus TaxID=1888 RepID=UPI0036F6B11B
MPNDREAGISPYREVAYLLGGYVALFGGVLSHSDPVNPKWPMLFIETPEGQCCWPIHPDNTDVFQQLNVPYVEGYPWDGHTTEENYLRIEALNRMIPKMTYARPEYGKP